ncbi:DUF3499 domain-containing protein [Kocuria sp. LUK]|uniref:DUF3499 domain-containing protein n=1 Tax=Kocuria sp. LUK TaxID=2897828 RepID=UPI0027DF1700|nr:DUF3499 domain-containing protein [Kocuria sp. LUK]
MSSSGSPARRCSRQTCTRDAVTTLTYVYSDSTAVVGPLASHAEPHAYDLCAVHADRLTAPRGWRVVRLEPPEGFGGADELGAVAEAVRESAPPAPARQGRPQLRDVSLPRTRVAGAGSAGAPAAAVRPAAPAPGAAADGTRAPERRRGEGPVAGRAAGSPPTPPAAGDHRDVPLPETMRRPHLRRP